MKIGIVGYQGAGKSALFHWLTGETPDPVLVNKTQAAMAPVPDPHVAELCAIYKPKKVTLASLEVVDTPGLSRTHEGSAAKLALIREASCLIMVIAAFDGSAPASDLRIFQEDLLIADLDIISRRIERLRESVKKPRPNRDELQAEMESLLPLCAAMEQGRPLHQVDMTPEQKRATRSFQLFSEKPRLIIINTADDEANPERFIETVTDGTPAFAFSLGLEMELESMTESERDEFCREMEVRPMDRDRVVRAIMDTSAQMLFFTAGEKEVRTWMIPRGATAVDAAGGIHTDLAHGFIRAETMNVDDLIRLGSEREMKAQHLVRHEPKDYVIQDGDVLLIRHN